MRLVPEQYIKIRDDILSSKDMLNNYSDYLIERRSSNRDDTFGTFIFDNVTDYNYSNDIKRHQNNIDMYENGMVVINPRLDCIDVGTKFTLQFSSGREEDFTMAESLIGGDVERNFMSMSCPVGKAVLGKKEGDVVCYQTPEGKRSVTIKKILKDDSYYIKPIRNDKKRMYVSRRGKKSIKDSILNGTYSDWLTMSKSQRNLIEKELRSLYSNVNSSNIEEVKNRIHAIKCILARYAVCDCVNDGTIGIGSIFSVRLKSTDDNLNLKNVELINRALSNELDTIYLERTSTLGSAVYGLREGDTFKVRLGNKTYIGEVYNITNQNTNSISSQYVK